MEGLKMSRSRVPHRVYTAEFKMEAVRLAQEVGVTEAARRLDMPMTSIQNWMKSGQLDARTQAMGKKVTQEQAELSRLRREVASLKVDNEILRKAAAYFAKGSR
jgi:transposase